MTRDAVDMFNPPDRGRFGDNEYRQNDDARIVKSDLCDIDLYLRNDNPNKRAIAVSRERTAPFERWIWLARSLIEYERIGSARNVAIVRVTLPQSLAKEKGLV